MSLSRREYSFVRSFVCSFVRLFVRRWAPPAIIQIEYPRQHTLILPSFLPFLYSTCFFLHCRFVAETTLKHAQRTQGYAIALLEIVASNAPEDATVRLVAAVAFKNLVKYGWHPEEVSNTQKKDEWLVGWLVGLFHSFID